MSRKSGQKAKTSRKPAVGGEVGATAINGVEIKSVYNDPYIYVGIDPGVSGGIAILKGEAARVYRMPVIDYRGHTRINPNGVLEILGRMPPGCKVFLEAVGGIPGQGAPRAFNFGEGCGIIRGILVARALPHELIPPANWKKQMGLTGKDKDASRAKASAMFPLLADSFKLKRDDGMAEAVLLAEWGRRRNNGIV